MLNMCLPLLHFRGRKLNQVKSNISVARVKTPVCLFWPCLWKRSEIVALETNPACVRVLRATQVLRVHLNGLQLPPSPWRGGRAGQMSAEYRFFFCFILGASSFIFLQLI